ncbi:hypothetical protein [Parvularcula bermudensis]|nr:hypothetical protein [Parvularcula bermudensis]
MMDSGPLHWRGAGTFLAGRRVSQGHPRSLGALHLIFLGIRCLIGTGVFVLTGVAAANYAGPGLVFSFALAG